MHFVTLFYMPKRIFSVTLHAKFAIIDCDCAGKKETFICSFAKLSQSPTPIVLSLTVKNGRVGQDIWKRRLLRFGFDVLKLRNFQMSVKNKATWMPRRCVIYIPQIPYSHWSIRTPHGNYWYGGCVIHIGVGLMRCSFRQTGQCEGLRTWSERQCRASRFFGSEQK